MSNVWQAVRVAPRARGLGREELKELYATFAPVVFRRARVLLGRDADAWDVVQEVFEKMLSSADQFRGEARPMTWVYRITTNLCFNHLRSRSLREPVGDPGIEEPALEAVEALEARNLVRRWLAHLTEREQEVATLLYIDGLTQEEVADVLQLSRKTINREVAALREKVARVEALREGVAS